MKKILIVDDEPFFLKVLGDALGVDFAIATARSAEKAILLIEDYQDASATDGSKFDLIITDLNLPGMNGFQFAQYIRTKNRIDRFTPVIMLTQHNITKEEARKHGCAAYLPKNDINKVVSIVRILMATP
jgi:two-component system chemotaxis sensor kinase CheA